MTDGTIRVVEGDRPIVVGSGIAGLTTALSLDGSTVITASTVGEGSSWLAQGGLAAAIGTDDDPTHHASDTVNVGGDIADAHSADLLTSLAPDRIEWLMAIGARFDTDEDGAVALGREAGHSRRRIVHAGGDATGAEIMRALRTTTAARTDIALLSGTRLIDLLRSDDRIVGVLAVGPNGRLTAFLGSAVVLATGGIGGVYARSTNPVDVTGTGLAAAARQGARLADMEFVQFHPTAFAATDHPAPLISEAIRGEGATLIDELGNRFMFGAHPDAELGPRDVVARAIWQHMAAGHRVFLDATVAIGAAMPERFPTAFTTAMRHGIDPRIEPIEVAPAEHFHMGGVATDLDGRTSLPGLWAAGEVASTGMHGANRLASNSLLEGVVMGQRVAESILHDHTPPSRGELLVPWDAEERTRAGSDRHARTVRSIAWRHLGIVRSGEGIEAAIRQLDALAGPQHDAALVASLIASAALERTESRGAHYRTDHPNASPEAAHRTFLIPEPAEFVTVARALPVGM
ncbi:MAG TPA: L-aspartate oxidase [Acidimicrobiia bacterium]|nr:L-aspartate oxidase [Acidimicrobiia bacterium]